MKLSPYKVLELSDDCTQDDIRLAYRRLARQYHPDVNVSKLANDKFIAIKEAYELLGNEERRKRYDAIRKILDAPKPEENENPWGQHQSLWNNAGSINLSGSVAFFYQSMTNASAYIPSMNVYMPSGQYSSCPIGIFMGGSPVFSGRIKISAASAMIFGTWNP